MGPTPLHCTHRRDGAKPGDLPIRFELVVDLTTAEALGIDMLMMLARA